MGITDILRRIWLFSANKIKSSESFSLAAHHSHHGFVTHVFITKLTERNKCDKDSK